MSCLYGLKNVRKNRNKCTYTDLPEVRWAWCVLVDACSCKSIGLKFSDLYVNLIGNKYIYPNAASIQLTWRICSRFKGEITRETDVGSRRAGRTMQSVFPEPVPALIKQSRPAKRASVASSWNSRGIFFPLVTVWSSKQHLYAASRPWASRLSINSRLTCWPEGISRYLDTSWSPVRTLMLPRSILRRDASVVAISLRFQ